MTLEYTLKFYDYWHISSGLSAGAKLDSTVVKDAEGLPYISGKTLKGLIREMAELLEKPNLVEKCFGGEGVLQGVCYFTNASLTPNEKEEIVSNNLQNHLYGVTAYTAIGKNGIAIDSSLREIEVVVPLTLQASIENIPTEFGEDMLKASGMIKRMGLNRTRGLGRCTIQGVLK